MKKCFKHLQYWEMGEGVDAREGERVDERDKGEHFKYPLVTKTANDEAVLSLRQVCKRQVQWQVRMARRTPQEGNLSITVACGSALLVCVCKHQLLFFLKPGNHLL